jgi:hypothetical protein
VTTDQPHNAFNMTTYRDIICRALVRSYKFVTLDEFVRLGCPDQIHFVLRHDVDKTPLALPPIIDVEAELGVKSTTYVRVAGAEYNPFSYPAMKAFQGAAKRGTEIGLHTSFFEYSQINGFDPLSVLKGELNVLRAFFDIRGISPHRDINYTYNSLPFLETSWQLVAALGVFYHAYEKRIMDATTYVNEGFNPHLCWRSTNPFEAIDKGNGRSIYMLTHPHWWFKDHPFEAP